MPLALAFFLLFSTLACRAQVALPYWNTSTQQAWWTANPTSASWPKAADALQAQLAADYKQRGASAFSQTDFQSWMEHLEWIRLGLASPDALAKPEDLKSFIALGQDEAISHLFVDKMVEKTVGPAALQNLIRLQQAGMNDLHEYAALGVAYALVFDEPFPRFWPHAQVDRDAVPIGDLDIVKRFQFYVQSNRDKKLDLDLTQLSVDDLKYLVDSEVKLSELTFAQANRIPYEHFADAFFSIKYDERRTSNGNDVFKWNHDTYLLSDIQQLGGICVDQAYYAATLGKGRGIPTIYFTGQGRGGGHAWFGYLTRSGKWNLDCGRYASQNYPKGDAEDPLDWSVVNDAALSNLAKNGASDPRYRPAKMALAWARMNIDTPAYKLILGDAGTIMPELTETWEKEGDYVDKSVTAIADKKAFYQSWIAQFTSYPDMKVEGQKRLLAALKAANDPDAPSLQQDIVLENRSTDFDLGVQGSLGAIEDKFKARDWDGARLEFEKSVRDFKDQGGGTFYYNVVKPYVMLCVQYGRMDEAQDGIHFMEERVPIESTSVIGEDFAKLKDHLNEMKDLFPAMQKWLGELDDGDYSRAWNDGSKMLQGLETSDQFVAHMNAVRKPLGKDNSRTMSKPPTEGDEITLGSGKTMTGEFFEVTYTGTFENNQTAQERLTFTKDSDGEWRPLFYWVGKT